MAYLPVCFRGKFPASGEIGVARPELSEHLRSYPSAPFVLFFPCSEDRVEIVRVLHERMDVERHV